MRRGDIWTVSGGSDYTGKPRPAVVIQDDAFAATASVTLCVFTSDPTEAPLFRIGIEPNDTNGLRLRGNLMADKITTVPRSKMGSRLGRLDENDLRRLDRALLVFLGLASPRRGRS